jgi:DNA-binding PadR family transcriptional regulator
MSTRHAVLSLLAERPAYPYELKDRVERRLGPSWALNSGQIYQTVKSLEGEGLITPVARAGRGDRHVFAITDEGVGELDRWFDEATERGRPARRPLLVKLTFAGPSRLRKALEEIDGYEVDCAERLSQLRCVHELLRVEDQRVRADHVMLRLNLSADIFALEAELRWSAHARQTVTWLIGQDALWPGGSRAGELPSEEQRRRERQRRVFFDRMAGDAALQAASGGADA